jgi:diguanylate cyclase (GGDEF)-like protein
MRTCGVREAQVIIPGTAAVAVEPSWVERDDDAARRDHRALARDLRAHQRDDQARHRDLAGRRRDREAAERDRAAMVRDAAAVHRNDPPVCVADRLAAAAERVSAGLDRIRAAGDRREAALDRRTSALDRWQASVDRLRGAEDRRNSRLEHARMAADELTGLLRRGNGLVRLEMEVDRAHRNGGVVTVAYVDVDGLKQTNDLHGHPAGDELLRDVAKALRDCMRSYDVVMRVGGDEFVCGMVNVPARLATERFEQVARLLCARQASVSTGIAELRSGESAVDLISRADRHLLDGRRQRSMHVRGRSVAPTVTEGADLSSAG